MNPVSVWKISPQIDEITPVSLPSHPKNLDEASQVLPAGAYTTFRTYQRKYVARLSQHIKRLQDTALLEGHPIQFDTGPLRSLLREIAGGEWVGDLRFRLTLDLTDAPGTLYVSVTNLVAPSESDYKNGVQLITVHLHRENPKAKLTNFIPLGSRVRNSLPENVHEAIMVDEAGFLLEGTSSNFFAVKNGHIYTADEGILNGITRSIVLEQTAKAGIPVHLSPVSIEDLPVIEEAFITSAGRAVLPAAQIDGKIIGDGCPGKITRQIMDGYQQAIDDLLEPI